MEITVENLKHEMNIWPIKCCFSHIFINLRMSLLFNSISYAFWARGYGLVVEPVLS